MIGGVCNLLLILKREETGAKPTKRRGKGKTFIRSTLHRLTEQPVKQITLALKQ
jgi:hypothetical protein